MILVFSVISRQECHLIKLFPSEGEKKNLSTNLTLYKAYTNDGTNLRRTQNKRKKEFSLEAWEEETSNSISLKNNNNNNEKAEKYCTNEGAS